MNQEALSIAIKAVQIYAEKHPISHQVTQVQAASMLNVSESTISRMVKTGRIRLNRFGMINISGVLGLIYEAIFGVIT